MLHNSIKCPQISLLFVYNTHIFIDPVGCVNPIKIDNDSLVFAATNNLISSALASPHTTPAAGRDLTAFEICSFHFNFCDQVANGRPCRVFLHIKRGYNT